MLLKRLEVENIGPISKVEIDFPKNDEKPKPLVVVGENGSGKSILLSHLVNTLLVGKQEVFEDVEIEKGKVYKYRSPKYVKSGEHYSFSNVEFESGEKVQEWQLVLPRIEFEEKFGFTSIRREWNEINSEENSHFKSTFDAGSNSTKQIFKNQCCLYFPVNRFEEPAWLNLENLKAKAVYTDLKRITGFSNREVICTSPLKNNNNWLLDLIFDRQLFDIKTQNIPLPLPPGQPQTVVPIFAGFAGQSASIYEAVLKVLRVILRESGNIRLGAGTRQNRQISVMKDEKVWVPNLFQLSTGEVQLLNLFLSIVRDYDLSEGEFKDLNDIRGIVIIDEIDSHLHTVHQTEVLPQLIKSFPNVQFVITTHSPLFLLGMESLFGEDGFEVLNMPTGDRVSPSDFSEFIAAYEAFKETTKYRAEIKSELERHSKPIVFVEGDYDIRYLNKAAEYLGKKELLDKVQIKDGDGFGNLDKVWKSYNNSVSGVVPNKIILIYDCDTNKQDTEKNLVYKRVVPQVNQNPIRVGIENLFSVATINKVEEANPRYIDIHEEQISRIRGETNTVPASKSVNKSEKGNMCDWLCENGSPDDFAGFEVVFQIIEQIING
ncbi:AAA family ATPase [Desulfuromonas sp. TF]|uniref:AAA family ATPase n=1 Tax=Desulfuromonas sp. TF TaxID=1232410 RepID=UPI0003FB9F58|nr:AAA family ATPase [Desulfuromonas sp. TF]